VEARIFAPVNTGPEAHSATRTIDTGSLFVGVMRLGGGVDHLPKSGAEVKERAELHPYFPFWAFMACSRENFAFHLHSLKQWVLRSLYPEVKWPECEAYFHLVLRL